MEKLIRILTTILVGNMNANKEKKTTVTELPRWKMFLYSTILINLAVLFIFFPMFLYHWIAAIISLIPIVWGLRVFFLYKTPQERIVSYIALGIAILLFIFLGLTGRGLRCYSLKCQNNLKGLYRTLMEYAMDNDEHFPPKGKILPVLAKSLKDWDDKRWPKLFICPATNDKLDPDKLTGEDIIRFSSYVTTQDQIDNDTPGSKPIIWDRKGNHKDQRNVLYFDGNIEYITEEEFQRLIEQYEGK